MLAQYHRWIYDDHNWKSVETLKQLVLQEAESQTVASETIQGANRSKKNFKPKRNRNEKAFFGTVQDPENQKFCHYVFKGHHGVWCYDKLNGLPIRERWDTSKKLKLCFRCLGDDHRGQNSAGTIVCEMNGCTDNHNRLLYES